MPCSHLGPFEFPGAKLLSHHNADGITKRKVHAGKRIPYRTADIGRSYHIQAPQRVALVQHGHTGSPQALIEQERRSPPYNIPEKVAGNVHRAIKPADIGEPCRMTVRPDDHNRKLRKTGKNRSNGSTDDAHPGGAEVPENEDIVKGKVHQHRHNPRLHRQQCFAGFSQGGCVSLRNGIRDQPDIHDTHILQAEFQRRLGVLYTALTLEVQPDELRPESSQYGNADARQHRADDQLKPHGVLNAVHIVITVKLRTENARPGHSAEDDQIKNKQQLVCNRNAGHFHGAYPTDHHIIQQTDKVRYRILHHNRHPDRQHPAVKCPAAKEFILHGLSPLLKRRSNHYPTVF